MSARTMNFPVDAGVLTCLLSVHVNMDWPRFVVSLFVLAGMVGFMLYSWVKR